MLSTWLRYVSVLNQRDLCKSFAFLVILLLIMLLIIINNDDIVLPPSHNSKNGPLSIPLLLYVYILDAFKYTRPWPRPLYAQIHLTRRANLPQAIV